MLTATPAGRPLGRRRGGAYAVTLPKASAALLTLQPDGG